ncbi:hypothetical protein FI667_g9357, partial [Globisporangium splendens]
MIRTRGQAGFELSAWWIMELPSRLKRTKWTPLGCGDSPMDNADFFLEFDNLLKWVDVGRDCPSPRVDYSGRKCRDSPVGSSDRASRERVWLSAAFKPVREERPTRLNELERLLRKTSRNHLTNPTKDAERKSYHIETHKETLKRKRAKDKIQDLKAELIELEKSLLRLQKQTDENASDDIETISTDFSIHAELYQNRVESKRQKKTPKMHPKGEKRTTTSPDAVYEQQEPVEAEIENVKPRDAARRQRHITRIFETALHENQPIPESTSKQSKSTPGQTNASIFDSLGRNLDAQYQQIDGIWKACGLANSNIEIQAEDRIVKGGSDAAILEHVHARASPFSVDALTRIMWRAAKRGIFTPTDGEMKVCKAMGNTLYITVVDTLRVENLSAAVHVSTHLVLKRFIEKHRVVFVWEAVVEMDGAVTASLAERGWHMIRDASPSKDMAACISQTYARASPACGSPNYFKDQSTDRAVIVAVEEICHRNMEMLQQVAENQLMDESLGAQKWKSTV